MYVLAVKGSVPYRKKSVVDYMAGFIVSTDQTRGIMIQTAGRLRRHSVRLDAGQCRDLMNTAIRRQIAQQLETPFLIKITAEKHRAYSYYFRGTSNAVVYKNLNPGEVMLVDEFADYGEAHLKAALSTVSDPGFVDYRERIEEKLEDVKREAFRQRESFYTHAEDTGMF